MKQVTDTGAIEKVVDEIIAANPDKVARRQGQADQLHRLVRRPGDEGLGRQGQSAGGERLRLLNAEDRSSASSFRRVLSCVWGHSAMDRDVRARIDALLAPPVFKPPAPKPGQRNRPHRRR
jgi:hypothetical protein